MIKGKDRSNKIMYDPFNVWVALGLFGIFFISDFISTLYVIFTAKHLALLATGASVLLTGLGFFGYLQFQRQPWYIIPILMGCALGTYLSIKLF